MKSPATSFHHGTGSAACAERGECTANKPYMVGAGSAFGHCGVSCGSCTQCDAADHACLTANRERLGYIGDLEPELAQLFPDSP